MQAATSQTALHRFFEFSLVGMMSCGFLAVAISGRLDLPTLVVAGSAIIVRALFASGHLPLDVSSTSLTVATVAYVGFFPVDIYYLSGDFLRATVHLVFFLSSLMLLRARTARDVFFMNLVALMEVMAGSLFAEGVAYLVFLGAFLIFAIAVMAGSEIRSSLSKSTRPRDFGLPGMERRLIVVSGMVFTGVLVIGGLMFIVLPRTARIALQNLIPIGYHLPGFSNEVRLGEIGEILQSSKTVMHVRSPRTVDIIGLRLRGTALGEFDGKRWFNPSTKMVPVNIDDAGFAQVGYKHEGRSGRSVEFEIQLMESTGDTIFLPGLPEHIYLKSPYLLRTEGIDSYRTGAGWARGLRYKAYSFVEDRPPVTSLPYVFLEQAERLRYLQTPMMDPRITQLAAEITTGRFNDSGKASAIEHRLKTTYGYTLELPQTASADPVAEFLFERKKGHCEYFASSMAVMLRVAGVPSRVVNGFVASEINPLTGWGVVRTSDAHSWVEAWIDGDGWRVYDPTPLSTAPPESGLWLNARNYLDAAEVFYRNWVLGYDIERQLQLAGTLNRSGHGWSLDWSGLWSRWKTRGPLMAQVLACLVVIGAFLYLVSLLWHLSANRRHQARIARGNINPSDATVLYQHLIRLLKKKGFERPPWMTPMEFLKSIPVGGVDASYLEEFTICYNHLRFGGRVDAAERMSVLLKALDEHPHR